MSKTFIIREQGVTREVLEANSEESAWDIYMRKLESLGMTKCIIDIDIEEV